ncbi:polysaccharide transporter, PST family [Nonomuraea solani]|uniref:Polysaccharide transporter, PST family n=1 Tax=Nonomuraea solani TaxID=1144553 RepID=A0A1H6CKW7_9ACTN|nr:oligosaccharide flippase family protein [Nonomuraea solani]SEG73631.1 polysaccharide transporter, PST family [Nonomuraea solani]
MGEPGESTRAGSAGRGLRWGLAARGVSKLATFGMSLVLARLLAAEDFGLYAVALAANQFLFYINDAGIVSAVVQWRGRLEDMVATATTVVLTISVSVYALFWFTAPFFTTLAGSASATPVVRLLTVIIVIDGFVNVRSAIMLRGFQQDKIAKANMAGIAVQVPLAITLASLGAGVYSFAVGAVANSLVSGILVLFWAKVPYRLGFDRAIAGRLLRFGVPLAGSLGLEALVLNADAIIIGNTLGLTMLGYYMLAMNVSSWVPGVVGEALRHVTLPGFSRVADENPAAFSDRVQQIVPMLVTLVTPTAVLIGVLAPQLVTLLYEPRWLPAAAALSFLMALMTVRMLTALAFDILTSLGATRRIVWMNLSWAAALLPALYLGARIDGIRGVAIGHVVAAFLVGLPAAAWQLRRSGVVLGPIGPPVARLLLGGLACGVTAWLVAAWTADTIVFVRLCAAGAAGFAVYVAIGISRDRLKQLRDVVMS